MLASAISMPQVLSAENNIVNRYISIGPSAPVFSPPYKEDNQKTIGSSRLIFLPTTPSSLTYRKSKARVVDAKVSQSDRYFSHCISTIFIGPIPAVPKSV
jgi:hypothetical protein